MARRGGFGGGNMNQMMKQVQQMQKKMQVEQGNSVIVIEHNLDVIKTADYIIDLGPEGGDGGGTVVACGTPEEIVKVKESYTGQYLKPYLNKNK